MFKRLQYKLVSLLIITSVIPLLTLGLITIALIQRMALSQAHQRIKSNLAISLSIYQQTVDNLKYVVRDVNRRAAVLIDEDQVDLLKNELGNYCTRHNLDFLEVTDKGGKILVSISNPGVEGSDISTDTFVKRALRFQTSVSTEIIERDELRRLGVSQKVALAGESAVAALAIKASTPLINSNEIIMGTLQAGYILNNNPRIVLDDVSKQTGLGASIFLGSVRIATTLRPAKGAKMVGEAMDKTKAQPVLTVGREFIGAVRMAGLMYQAGYVPLYDYAHAIVGMFGLGIPEREIFFLRNRLLGFFVCAVLAAIILSFSFGLRKERRILASVQKLRRGIEAFGKGDLFYRVDLHTHDELEELADFFNLTMSQLMSTKQQIVDYSVNIGALENTVQQSSKQLEATQKKLFEYERMAAMGRMATALSHELRNTFAEINSGIYSLRQKLSGVDPAILATVDTLRDSLDYATTILTSALTFSYPKKPILSTVDLNYLIDDLLAMPNIKELFRIHGIKVTKNVSGVVPSITADGLQLREMVTNIVVNGAQAMENGGQLLLSLEGIHDVVRIRITDAGPGMSEETLKNIFTPFFTTKPRGLGLGLCISRMIAREHGGSIEVESTLGKGTTFIISIPIARPV